MVRRITALLTLLMLVFTASVYAAPEAEPAKATEVPANTQTVEADDEGFPLLHAAGAILIDTKSGSVIHAKDENKQLYPASTTKIMTAIIVLENAKLEDEVEITETMVADITNKHSHMSLKVGEKLTVEELLIGMLVYSANDAANALAEKVGGTIENFVAVMNNRALELGATNTHFANPHGYHNANHYTTASDLAKFALHAMTFPKFRETVAIKTTTLAPTNMTDERFLSNTNYLISKFRNTFHYYTLCTGIKTGYTEEAGYCLVASAKKGEMELLSVVLGCQNVGIKETAYSYTDTREMFDYTFENYKQYQLAATTDVVADSSVYEAKGKIRVALTPSSDLYTVLPNGFDPEQIIATANFPERIDAPVKKGEIIGTVTYTYKGEELAKENLVAANDVERDFMVHLFHLILKILLSPFVLIPAILIISLVVYNKTTREKRKKERRKNMRIDEATGVNK